MLRVDVTAWLNANYKACHEKFEKLGISITRSKKPHGKTPKIWSNDKEILICPVVRKTHVFFGKDYVKYKFYNLKTKKIDHFFCFLGSSSSWIKDPRRKPKILIFGVLRTHPTILIEIFKKFLVAKVFRFVGGGVLNHFFRSNCQKNNFWSARFNLNFFDSCKIFKNFRGKMD